MSGTPTASPRPAACDRWGPRATRTTTRWRNHSTACTRPSASTRTVHGTGAHSGDSGHPFRFESGAFGVGPKVADCVMLFSMHKMEAFPVDVWMLRCIQSIYSQKMGLQDILRDKKSLTRSTYDLVHRRAHEYFGRYCGYAQQYLYMKIRDDFIRNKALV